MRCDAMRPWLAAVGVGRTWVCKSRPNLGEKVDCES